MFSSESTPGQFHSQNDGTLVIVRGVNSADLFVPGKTPIPSRTAVTAVQTRLLHRTAPPGSGSSSLPVLRGQINWGFTGECVQCFAQEKDRRTRFSPAHAGQSSVLTLLPTVRLSKADPPQHCPGSDGGVGAHFVLLDLLTFRLAFERTALAPRASAGPLICPDPGNSLSPFSFWAMCVCTLKTSLCYANSVLSPLTSQFVKILRLVLFSLKTAVLGSHSPLRLLSASTAACVCEVMGRRAGAVGGQEGSELVGRLLARRERTDTKRQHEKPTFLYTSACIVTQISTSPSHPPNSGLHSLEAERSPWGCTHIPRVREPLGRIKVGVKVKVLSANQFVHQHYPRKLPAVVRQQGAKVSWFLGFILAF